MQNVLYSFKLHMLKIFYHRQSFAFLKGRLTISFFITFLVIELIYCNYDSLVLSGVAQECSTL